jgi:hypothetical protein
MSEINVLSYWTIDGGGNMGNEFQSIAVQRLIEDELKLKVDSIPWNFLSIWWTWKRKLVVMNGWFGFPNFSFPPSQSINPVYIGFHNNQSDVILDESGIAHLKRFQPIGCRDTHTMLELQSVGIASYVSYCPTLLIKSRANKDPKKICIVDGHTRIGHIPDVTSLLNDILEHLDNTSDIEYLSQNFHKKWIRTKKSAFSEAGSQLDKILNSKLVITNRLHVALPCLANSVPCVLIYDKPELDSRIASYIPYLWVLTPNWNNLPSGWDWNKPEATTPPFEIIQKLRDDLLSRVTGAMNLP